MYNFSFESPMMYNNGFIGRKERKADIMAINFGLFYPVLIYHLPRNSRKTLKYDERIGGKAVFKDFKKRWKYVYKYLTINNKKIMECTLPNGC